MGLRVGLKWGLTLAAYDISGCAASAEPADKVARIRDDSSKRCFRLGVRASAAQHGKGWASLCRRAAFELRRIGALWGPGAERIWCPSGVGPFLVRRQG
jgi:hypothetical protein